MRVDLFIHSYIFMILSNRFFLFNINITINTPVHTRCDGNIANKEQWKH